MRAVSFLAVMVLAASGCVWSVQVSDEYRPYSYSDDVGARGYSESWQVSGDGSHIVRSTYRYSYTFEGESGSWIRRVRVERATGEQRAIFTGLSADLSADGSLVVFVREPVYDWFNEARPPDEVMLGDVATGTQTLISAPPSGADPNGHSRSPKISADGSTVTFTSRATNLLPGTTTTGQQLFRYDVATGVISLVSQTPTGEPAAEGAFLGYPSHDGSVIAFSSESDDLVADDNNGVRDVFVVSGNGPVTRPAIGLSGAEPNGDSTVYDLSDDGSTLVLLSDASNLVPSPDGTRLYLFGPNGPTEQFAVDSSGQPVDNAWFHGISSDGSLVLFSERVSLGNEFLLGTRQTWLRDRSTMESTALESPTSTEFGGGRPSLTADGRLVLLPGLRIEIDFPRVSQTVTHHLQTAQEVRIDSVSPGTLVPGEATSVVVSGSGLTEEIVGRLLRPGGDDEPGVTGVIVNDRSEAVLEITLAADAAPGSLVLVVSSIGETPFGQQLLAADSCQCLTVASPPAG